MWPGQLDCLWLCDYILLQLSLPTTQHDDITAFGFLRSKFLVSHNLFTIFISNNKMISAKKLIKLAKKWQKLAAIRRKRITSSVTTSFGDVGTNSCSTSTSSTMEKGHLVVYSADQRRFVLPLEYLKNEVVQHLFSLAEEEFGLPSNGPLMLPCDAAFMEYVISLIKRNATADMKKALLTSIASGCCSSSSYLRQQLPVCSF
ncbi:hypothetical protein DITRI_Ditri01bG0030400 [Diplodiscus trichospermus]